MPKTKCVVIREELVALTGDYKKAIVLGQMIYWSERVRDRAAYKEEERRRLCCGEEDHTYNHGWFYKRAEDLSEETMMGVKPKAMREYVKSLVQQEWLLERRNPVDKMDRTLHYRVNRVKVERDLAALGYILGGCEMEHSIHTDVPSGDSENSYIPEEVSNVPKEAPNIPIGPSDFQKCPSYFPNGVSKQSEETAAISEKENTPILKTLEPQRFQATDLAPEINKTKIIKTEITKTEITQQQDVRARILNRFGQELSEQHIQTLLHLANAEGVDLIDIIENTYQYHTKVQKCRNLFGALHYAIHNGGWEIECDEKQSNTTIQSPPLPKAVQDQLDPNYDPHGGMCPLELEEKRKSYRKGMERLGYRFDEYGKPYRPEDETVVS